MSTIKICPKCKGEMIAGNFTGPVIDWEAEGTHSFLKGGGVKITTYACAECGYMESYIKK